MRHLLFGLLSTAVITQPRIATRVLTPQDTVVLTNTAQIDSPLTLTRDATGLLHWGLDPKVLGVKILLDGKEVGVSRELNIVTGKGFVVTAMAHGDRTILQLSLAPTK